MQIPGIPVAGTTILWLLLVRWKQKRGWFPSPWWRRPCSAILVLWSLSWVTELRSKNIFGDDYAFWGPIIVVPYKEGHLGRSWGLGCACVQECLQERSQWCCFSCNNPEDGQTQQFVTSVISILHLQRHMQVYLASSNTGEMLTDCVVQTQEESDWCASGPSSFPCWVFFLKATAAVLFSLCSLCGCLHWETPKLYGMLSEEGIPLNNMKFTSITNWYLMLHLRRVTIWGRLCSAIFQSVLPYHKLFYSQHPLPGTAPCSVAQWSQGLFASKDHLHAPKSSTKPRLGPWEGPGGLVSHLCQWPFMDRQLADSGFHPNL